MSLLEICNFALSTPEEICSICFWEKQCPKVFIDSDLYDIEAFCPGWTAVYAPEALKALAASGRDFWVKPELKEVLNA